MLLILVHASERFYLNEWESDFMSPSTGEFPWIPRENLYNMIFTLVYIDKAE